MRTAVALLSVVALAFAVPAAADPPTAFPFEFSFEDVNPCSGDTMTVTIFGTVFVHAHDSRSVVRLDRTITTSDGFVGRGTETQVDNGQVFVARLTDILTNDAGDRFRARSVFVFHISTETVRVDRFALTCLRP